MVTINDRPQEICFSEDLIIYQLHTNTPANTEGLTIDVALFFCPGNSTDFNQVFTQPCYPDAAGNVSFYPSEIINCYLSYVMPATTGGDIADMVTQVGKFYIKYRERIGDEVVAWETDIANTRNVIKGHTSYHMENKGAYFTNYLPAVKPFLTWQQSGRLCGNDETMFLYFLLTTSTVSGLAVKITTTFTDGTHTDKTVPFPGGAVKYHVYSIPAGMVQRNITSPAGKSIYYYEISVINSTGVLAAPFRYEVDNRPFVGFPQFVYRNGLGGLDSVRLLGSKTPKIARELTQAELSPVGEYDLGYVVPQVGAVGVAVQTSYAANIGFLGKTELQYILEILATTSCWEVKASKWWPVIITTSSYQLPSSTDELYSLQLEYQHGFRQTSFLPDSINF